MLLKNQQWYDNIKTKIKMIVDSMTGLDIAYVIILLTLIDKV